MALIDRWNVPSLINFRSKSYNLTTTRRENLVPRPQPLWRKTKVKRFLNGRKSNTVFHWSMDLVVIESSYYYITNEESQFVFHQKERENLNQHSFILMIILCIMNFKNSLLFGIGNEKDGILFKYSKIRNMTKMNNWAP